MKAGRDIESMLSCISAAHVDEAASRAAARTVQRNALDATDEALLLDVLGLAEYAGEVA